jgi:hypothetical protein
MHDGAVLGISRIIQAFQEFEHGEGLNGFA